MRSLMREWKAVRNPDGTMQGVRHTWTHRARWYDSGSGGTNIRLQFEDDEGIHNHYPDTYDDALELWDRFKKTGDRHVE